MKGMPVRGIGRKLIGDPEHFSFEERIFNFTILLGILMTAVGTVLDWHQKVDIRVNLGFIGCWAFMYYFTRVKGQFKIVAAPSLGVFVFAFFPYTWIYCGGMNSLLPYYGILVIAIISIILSGRVRIGMVLSMIGIEILLIATDGFRWGVLEYLHQISTNMYYMSLHLIIVMAAMAVLIAVYSNIYMKEKVQREAYAETIRGSYHQQLYYMENLEQLIYELKSGRHDYNNHLGVIYGLLEGAETEKAREYAGQLVKTAVEYQNLVNIPYPMMRAMLNYKLSTAKEQNISLHQNILVPEKLPLDEFDITVILGNLLDNAIEACMKVEENSRNISLTILFKPDYLIIQVENSMVQELAPENARNQTTKEDKENHGFGLNNIRYLVNKYNGLLKIEQEKDVFKVDIALLVNPREEKSE